MGARDRHAVQVGERAPRARATRVRAPQVEHTSGKPAAAADVDAAVDAAADVEVAVGVNFAVNFANASGQMEMKGPTLLDAPLDF